MKLKALGPVKHNGKRYEEGETFDVEDKKQAQALIDSGSAARPGARTDDGDDDENAAGTDDPKTVKVVSNTPTPSKVEKATK